MGIFGTTWLYQRFRVEAAANVGIFPALSGRVRQDAVCIQTLQELQMAAEYHER